MTSSILKMKKMQKKAEKDYEQGLRVLGKSCEESRIEIDT